MKTKASYIICLYTLFLSCSNNAGEKNKTEPVANREPKALTKPPASFRDTMQIDFMAAVFYHPDSLQLETVKQESDTGKFEAAMHEYFYQMRNARMSIKKDWSRVKIVEAQNVRYLLFRGKDKDTIIDLNTRNDLYGLFLFRPGALPHITDMMNIDTELGFYFGK